MATVITTDINIDEREKGFRNALDMLAQQKISEECVRGYIQGRIKHYFSFFLQIWKTVNRKCLKNLKIKLL